tara:strand:- start:113 stop:259 length:147 start_codon:yes stop_codon:yes gene_type:complete
MRAKNTLETLENVRENISNSLTEGVKNRSQISELLHFAHRESSLQGEQ